MIKSTLFKVCSIAYYTVFPYFGQFMNATPVRIITFWYPRRNQSAAQQLLVDANKLWQKLYNTYLCPHHNFGTEIDILTKLGKHINYDPGTNTVLWVKGTSNTPVMRMGRGEVKIIENYLYHLELIHLNFPPSFHQTVVVSVLKTKITTVWWKDGGK